MDICQETVKDNDINTFLHYLLKGFTDCEESKEKRFNVINFILKTLDNEELNMKLTLDLITRISVDLDTYSNAQIVKLAEQCVSSIRKKDSKTVYWKDLIPQLIGNIRNIKEEIHVNDISMTGSEYRSAIIKNITLISWRLEILTPLAAMFK